MWLTHSNRFNNYLYVTGVYLPRTWLTGPHVFSFGSWTLSESTWGVVELWMLHCSDICMKYTEILSEDVWTIIIVSSASLSDLHTYVGAYMCCLYCLYMVMRDIKDLYNQELQSPDVTKRVHIYIQWYFWISCDKSTYIIPQPEKFRRLSSLDAHHLGFERMTPKLRKSR